jgi:hypothetical protein
VVKTGADVRVRTSAGANSNPCPPQEAVNNNATACKTQGCTSPSRNICSKLNRFSKQAFPILAGQIDQAVQHDE